jgi:SAM-dependent methyltransferase
MGESPNVNLLCVLILDGRWQNAQPQLCVQSLDAQLALPFFQAYKVQTFALLQLRPGQRVLDVGCGTGDDACELAKGISPGGLSIGLDYSSTMVIEAQKRSVGISRPVKFCQGDVHHLGFAAEQFDACRADRTFQHLADPRQALLEIKRVTRSGGRIVIVDPDHETMLVDSPDMSVTRRFFNFRSDQMRQGRIAHHMPALFKDIGLIDVQVMPLTRLATDFVETEGIFQLTGGMRLAQQAGVVTAAEADNWIDDIRRAAAAGQFLFSLNYFITSGQKP